MSQHEERAKAILRIRKLMDQTTDRGRTEGEMNQAMEQMGKLLTTFNLSMNEVAIRGQEFTTIIVDTGSVKSNAMVNCVMGLARFCDVKVWFTGARKSGYKFDSAGRYRASKAVTNKMYNFFGAKQDVEMAEFLYKMIDNSLKSETAQFMKSGAYQSLKGIRGQKKSALHSFGLGFASRVYWRLTEMKREMEKEIHAAESGPTDLILIKSKVVEEEFKNLGLGLRKSTYQRSGANNSTGFAAGSSAGNKINLSRPVNTGNTSRTLALA